MPKERGQEVRYRGSGYLSVGPVSGRVRALHKDIRWELILFDEYFTFLIRYR